MALLSAVVLYCFVAITQLVTSTHGQSTQDFINIDCGYDGEAYLDNLGMLYSPDKGFISTGVIRNVTDFDPSNRARRYRDLRIFPNGTRNCYTLPARAGKKYLVRAGFFYGNYDGLNQPPTFDLYLGVNFWGTVKAVDTYDEILAVSPTAYMQVCLVKKGTGIPFVSFLGLRPLLDTMYPLVNASQFLRLHQDRYNYGGQPNVQIRFPDDHYDRIWNTPSNQNSEWKNLSIDSSTTQVKPSTTGWFPVPQVVIGTAVTTTSLSKNLSFTVSSSADAKIYLVMHFSELQQLRTNESRMFEVYKTSTELWFKAYSPSYLQAEFVYTVNPGAGGTTTYYLVPTDNSTLPPILNALEVFSLQQITRLPTDEGDVSAMLDIKRFYQVGRNWDDGDPCAPQQFIWEGVGCSSDPNPRITSLNLYSSNLTGSIPVSLANLTALKVLDLSGNNLTGEIPGFLAELPALQDLNLMNNHFSGAVPKQLLRRSQEGSLRLRIEGNPCLGNDSSTGSCNGGTTGDDGGRKKVLVPIAVTAAGAFVALVISIVVLAVWARNNGRRKKVAAQQGVSSTGSIVTTGESVESAAEIEKSYRVNFSEVAVMTDNFERVIGRGGFGFVYHGNFPGRGGVPSQQVAVKLLSSSSSQGAKEFQAEARVLTRIHHKNLVSLLGYCTDENHLALIYEFMPHGSLAHHLSAVVRLSAGRDAAHLLTWRTRLSIAADVAQGLDYLHNGCNPPIIHRDVKTANILLDECMGAKLSDFGLSRTYSSEAVTHVTTGIAGTQGYLDPEYFRTYRLNEKSDVYSFGVVLLELITGQAPINNDLEPRHLADRISSSMRRANQLPNIVDHSMMGDYDANSVWEAVVLAMACTSRSSLQRPTMGEVLFRLKQCLAIEAARSAAF